VNNPPRHFNEWIREDGKLFNPVNNVFFPNGFNWPWREERKVSSAILHLSTFFKLFFALEALLRGPNTAQDKQEILSLRLRTGALRRTSASSAALR